MMIGLVAGLTHSMRNSSEEDALIETYVSSPDDDPFKSFFIEDDGHHVIYPSIDKYDEEFASFSLTELLTSLTTLRQSEENQHHPSAIADNTEEEYDLLHSLSSNKNNNDPVPLHPLRGEYPFKHRSLYNPQYNNVIDPDSPQSSLDNLTLPASNLPLHHGHVTDPLTGDEYNGPYYIMTTATSPNSNSANEHHHQSKTQLIRHGEGATLIQKGPRASLSKFLGRYHCNYPYEGTWVTPSYTFTGKLNKGGKFIGWGVLARSNGRSYEGEFWDGLYHGVGKESYRKKDGSQGVDGEAEEEVYAGEFWGGMRHGIGALVVTCRRHHRGSNQAVEAINKKEKNGGGEEEQYKYTYSGTWYRNCKEGEGTEAFASGEAFQGQFFRGVRYGKGILTTSNGTIKEGKWRAGYPVDHLDGWKITYPDQNVYEGETVHATPHGMGIMRYAASTTSSSDGDDENNTTNEKDRMGAVYTGMFRNGVRHGRGACVYPVTGEKIEGLWVEDEPLMEPPQEEEITDFDTSNKEEQDCDEEKKDADEESDTTTSTDTTDDSSTFTAATESSLSLVQLINYSNGDTYRGSLHPKNKHHRHGFGIYTYNSLSNNSTYEGKWYNNLRHGKGMLITAHSKYDGMFHENKKSGMGTLIYNDYSSYEGSFANGSFHGEGTLCESDGRVFVGEYKYGVKDGVGMERYGDGKIYVGEFSNGVKCGLGKLQEKVGGRVIYSGEWANDMMDGEGVLRLRFPRDRNEEEDRGADDESNGQVGGVEYKGMFVQGERSGFGTLTTDNVTLKGTWLRDLPVDGKWSVFHKDSSAFQGQACWRRGDGDDNWNYHVGVPPFTNTNTTFTTLEDDFKDWTPIPNGFGTIRYKNEDLYTGNLVEGKREGRGLCVFSNGDKWDGQWTNDGVDVDGNGVLTLGDGTIHTFGETVSGLMEWD